MFVQKSQLSQRLLTPISDAELHAREHFISQLEESQEKISCLERQVQSLQDEKDDLLTEKSFFSEKCKTLEKCLEEEKTKAPPPSESLVEAIIEENRQLNLKLLGLQAERDQALNRIERYKRAQEKLKERDSSQLQIVHFSKHHESQKAMKRIGELETLANSLSESVKEKSIGLTHQREANKLLASRIAELEQRLKTLEISGLLPQGTTREDKEGTQQLWKAGPVEVEEEDEESRGQHLEQSKESLPLPGAKKVARDHVEVA